MTALRPPQPHEGEGAEPGGLPSLPGESGETANAGPQRFPCGQCGAELLWKPGAGALQCEYCGFTNTAPEGTGSVDELDFRAMLAELERTEEVETASSVRCQACAAEVDKPTDIESFTCPFCGSAIVAAAESRRLIKPKALLPFKIERAAARDRYHHWLASLWFAPGGLKKYARLTGGLKGVYVPYWTYDANTRSQYEGMRGEHYWVTVGSGKNKRRVRKTRWYPASGAVRDRFDDILILASRSLPQRYADRLEPWDLSALTPLDHAYLSGFTTERYQVDLAQGFGQAKSIMDDHIRTHVASDIGGDTQRIHWIKSEYKDLTFKHILLPIWIAAYRYREKTYRFLVNARTGEVQGERPWSWLKIAGVVLLGLVVVGLGAWLVSRSVQ